jgi:hypothetical protein
MAGVSQELEDLTDVCNPASRCPAPAVYHHDGRTRTGALLNVSVERQFPRVGDVTLDARDDVVAVRIADVDGGAWLRECRGRTGREHEKD